MGEKTKTAKRFEGKVVIISASTTGIGFCIAHRLASEGASIVISSRSQKNVEDAVKKLKANGIVEVSGVVCHVSNAQHRKNLIQHTVQTYGKIDVIVANAGVNPTPESNILNTSESALNKLWDVNVKASILLVQEASTHLAKGSSILFVSSIAAYQPSSLTRMYGVTKAALIALTKALACEMGPDIRVNCIAPGLIPTKFSSIALKHPEEREAVIQLSCLKRTGTVEEIAAAATFLISDDASYITGETLIVAGGTHARL